MELLENYFSPHTSQSQKKEAQIGIEQYLETSFNHWPDIIAIMQDLTTDSLQRLHSDYTELIRLQWPLQALSYIAEKKFNEVLDQEGFYHSLFEVYEQKWDIIQQNSLFFGKFVEVFTKLAFNDPSVPNFEGVLTRFKQLLKDDVKNRLTHSRFIAKFLHYLYEDAFENIDDNKLTFTKELKLKHNHSNELLSGLRESVQEYENEPIDDLITGITCLYIFKASDLQLEDRQLLCSLDRYANINSFVKSAWRILDRSCMSEEDIVEVCKWFSQIWDAQPTEETLELICISMYDAVKCTFDTSMDSETTTNILKFIMQLIEETEGRYKACMHLFEALSQYVRQIYLQDDEFVQLGLSLMELWVKKSK